MQHVRILAALSPREEKENEQRSYKAVVYWDTCQTPKKYHGI